MTLRLVTLVSSLLLWVSSLRATEFGGWLAEGEPQELHRVLETPRGLVWYRSLGNLGSSSPLEEQFVFFPGATVHWDSSILNHVHSYPEDLRRVYEAARSTVARKPSVDAWEIGNEMEFIFSRDLPDRVATATKAARLGLRAGGARGRILMPSLAFRPGPFARELVANGIHRWSDGWNIHFYSWSQDFVGNLREHRRFLHDLGSPELPLWLTEVGTLEMDGDGTRPPRLLLDRQAVFFERSAVEAWMLGAAGYGAFTFSPYVQGPIDLGLTEADRSPRPALDRLLFLTRTLPVCRPLHWLRDARSGDDVGVVLRRPDGLWWTILWTPNRRTEEDLPPPTEGAPPDLAPTNSTFGLTLSPPRGTRVGTSPGVLVPWDPDVHAHLAVSAATNWHLVSPPGSFAIDGVRWDPWKPESRPSKPHEPGPVVLQWRVPGATADRDGLCHRIPGGSNVLLRLVAYNFSSRPSSGRWQVSVPAGWRILEGGSGRIRIPADGQATNTVVVAPPAKGLHSQERAAIRAVWKSGWKRADESSITLASRPAATEEAEEIPWMPSWQSDSRLHGWSAEPCPDGLMRLRLDRVSGTGPQPGLVAALPDGIRPRESDVVRVRLKPHAGPRLTTVRVEFVTGTRIVHGLSLETGPQEGPWTGDFRLGDAESSFWSRADPGRRSGASEVRWVRILFPGISTATEFDLLGVELRRVRN